jgi:hypothetical protein
MAEGMMLVIVGTLALLVLIGSVTMIWGVRRFKLSSVALAVAFALTAASWLAFLIATISITAITLALSSV